MNLLLEDVTLGTAILYVIAVLAIIAVGGLVIYLLAALVVSIIDKKEVKPFSATEEKTKQPEEQKLLLENNDYQLTLDDEKKPEPEKAKDEKPKEVDQTIDLDLADEEKKEIDKNRNSLAERENIVSNNAEPTEEKSDEDDDLEAMYQKLIADINNEATEGKEQEPKEKVEEPVKEEVVEPKEEVVEEPVQEPVAPKEPEPVVEEPKDDEEKLKLQNQIEELRAKLEAEQAEKDAAKTQAEELQKKLAEKPAVETQVVETENLDTLLARKDVLEQRLVASEKDLKANKKEYIPLSRIKKNLESDKAKLRRKEAVVAKQKVVLFGVNNYVVDPEKEKKLSEDLDVLDALRLSVQHCEEVMKDNEDRYPILEKTNGILTKQVEDLRNDIADLDTRIAKLQNGGNTAK